MTDIPSQITYLIKQINESKNRHEKNEYYFRLKKIYDFLNKKMTDYKIEFEK